LTLLCLNFSVTYVPGLFCYLCSRFIPQGGADRFTEDLSEFRQIYLWIQVLVGNVMALIWVTT
ncbi:hypothetical protein, partial [Leptospira weilii]|uniref:hypothetical protein n=1 Tax=Leptospira weilii TaxID=28184 RepID=UPI001F455490